MFQNLRQGAQVYVLYKGDTPHLEIGEVTAVGLPTPQFNANYQQNNQFFPPKNVIDIKVKVNEQTLDLQKLPADNTIADFGGNGMVISTSKESILAEIEALRTSSQRILDSMERHQTTIQLCSNMIEELNPEIKQQAERDKELDNLKSDMSDMKKMLSDLLTKMNNTNGVD